MHAAWEAVMVDARAAMEAAMTSERKTSPGNTTDAANAVAAAAVAATNESTTASSTAAAAEVEAAETPEVFQACDVWNRMGVEESVRYTAKVSPAVSAAAAAAIMFAATRSWRVTLAALAGTPVSSLSR